MKRAFTAAAALAATALAAAPAAAQGQPQAIATFKDWSVFVVGEGADRICYAATDVSDKSPKSVNHGEVFFLIASWKSGAARNQPSFRAGYNLKDAPRPVVRVGSDKWDMFADQNEAFIESAASEQALVAAMRRGSDMRVNAMSARGTATSYEISLLGVSAALDRVAAECR